MKDLRLAIILEAAGNSTRFGSNKLLHIMPDGRPMISCILDTMRSVRNYYPGQNELPYADDMQDQSHRPNALCSQGSKDGGSRHQRYESKISSDDPMCAMPSEGIINNSADKSAGISGISGISLILVTQYDEVAALAPDYKTVMNCHPELGISKSMQLGIEAAGDADAYMFCVCDQPYLTSRSVIRLIGAFCRAQLIYDTRRMSPSSEAADSSCGSQRQGTIPCRYSQECYCNDEASFSSANIALPSSDNELVRDEASISSSNIALPFSDNELVRSANKKASQPLTYVESRDEAGITHKKPENISPAPCIVSLSWKGQMYNPKIFSSYYRDELMRLRGDKGGRQIISAHSEDLILVEAASEAEVSDIDTRV